MRHHLKKTVITIVLTALFFFPGNRTSLADPIPLPPDPNILSLVNGISQDSLFNSVSTLVDFYTRHTYSDTLSVTSGIGAARQWLLSRFDQYASASSLYFWAGYWSGHNYPCYNIQALLSGSDPNNNLVILGGHIDSRAASSSSITDFAPGADDDASGTAALLEISRMLTSLVLSNTVSLNAFTGEEQGLYGSTAYAQNLQSASVNVKAMVNMDMIAL